MNIRHGGKFCARIADTRVCKHLPCEEILAGFHFTLIISGNIQNFVQNYIDPRQYICYK